ncbi:MAG: sulfatase-like hydrolase/transferase, partial [Bacteroidota bacterium]
GIYAMIESIDEQLGYLFAELEAAGTLENTIVVFATDNGPNGDRFRAGLKGTKGQVDEGGVRVPFGIMLPGDHPANGTVQTTPAAHIDLLPTILDYLERPIPNDLDGQSLLPLLNQDTVDAFNHDRYIYAFKQGYDFKPYPGSMRNDHLLYVLRGPDEHELYQIDKDEGQLANIIATDEAFLADLREMGRVMAATYAQYASTVARPELVAPPISLDASPGAIRLLAHEGEPQGATRFQDQYGWANDFFVDLGPDGAYWPIATAQSSRYTVTIRYHLAGNKARTLVLSTDKGNEVSVELPVALTEQIPVADRVQRKEVYPRQWAEVVIPNLPISAGASQLRITAPKGEGLWVKSLALQPVD